MTGADELAALQGEFEQVTCETARLLLQADFDEEELWDLDARARELRQRIRSAALRAAAMPRRKRVTVARCSGGMVSGG